MASIPVISTASIKAGAVSGVTLPNNEITIAGNMAGFRAGGASRSVASQAQALANQTGGNILGFTYE